MSSIELSLSFFKELICLIYNNPIFWPASALLVAIGTLWLGVRKHRISHKKPHVRIERISTKPTQLRGQLKKNERCKIRAEIINQPNNRNILSFRLTRLFFKKEITDIEDLIFDGPDKRIIKIDPLMPEVKGLKNRWLVLTIKDIRRKKTRKYFKFKDRPKEG